MSFFEDLGASIRDTVSKASAPQTPPRPVINEVPAGPVDSPARNGSLEVVPKEVMKVDEFEDFVNKKQPFQKMLAEWSLEDDQQKRSDIFRAYNNANNFTDNSTFDYFVDRMSEYEVAPTNDQIPEVLKRARLMSTLQQELDAVENRQRSFIYRKA